MKISSTWTKVIFAGVPCQSTFIPFFGRHVTSPNTTSRPPCTLISGKFGNWSPVVGFLDGMNWQINQTSSKFGESVEKCIKKHFKDFHTGFLLKISQIPNKKRSKKTTRSPPNRQKPLMAASLLKINRFQQKKTSQQTGCLPNFQVMMYPTPKKTGVWWKKTHHFVEGLHWHQGLVLGIALRPRSFSRWSFCLRQVSYVLRQLYP